jgi:hypothetical protein
MTHEPPRRPPSPPSLPASAPPHGAERDEPTSDRPTVNPPFDVEAFARATASSPRTSTWPPERIRSPDTPTARPPPPDASPREERGDRITLTNEVELERALAKSMSVERADTAPRRVALPRNSSSSALSIANARAPSVPEMPAVRKPSPSNIEAAVLGAIGNTGPEITERTIEDPIGEMRERFSLGDYTGALEMAELLLTEDSDDLEAAACAESCRGVLESMYAARLGPLDRVPSVVVQRTQLRWLSIDHRAGFVLSLIDGTSNLEMILDVCGMPRLDAMRILNELVQQKIVALTT